MKSSSSSRLPSHKVDENCSSNLYFSLRFQQALLLGDLHLSERRIRALVAGAEWLDNRGHG